MREAKDERGEKAGAILDRDLKELMQYLENSSFVEFEIEREGLKLKLRRRTAADANGQAASEPPRHAVPAPVAVPVAAPAAPAAAPAAAADDAHLVKSPIVGTFYRAAAPDAKPFVSPGDRVSKGQVLCIVEAMKLMNEIESDCDGEILEALVANGQPVEYGEPLFRVRPSGSRG
ncbi:MAG TPA: acetyl-CoA carboxylase biotin carboxyl carrier protein [Candidatus Polarisedimenticolia bacterium]|nr:acetyl-CoA carboxylase biotin carboxyl carrier protein [Candidatus Polarisedimenticolia bacterium]